MTTLVCVLSIFEVMKGVMVENIEKLTERGDKLEDLGKRAGEGSMKGGGGGGRRRGKKGKFFLRVQV